MAEALGIIASVIAIGTLAVQSSQALLDFVRNVKEAPEQITAISKDTEAFGAIVSSLRLALQEQSVQEEIIRDAVLFEIVAKLKDPLSNCSETLDKLTVKLKAHFKPTPDGHYKLSKADFKWHLNKNDIAEYQTRLSQNKATLAAAQLNISNQCNFLMLSNQRKLKRAPTVAESIKAPSSAPTGADSPETDAGAALKAFSAEAALLRQKFREALHDAAKHGDASIVNLLLECGTEVDARVKADEMTPLHVAAMNGKEEVARTLLEHGADIEAKTASSDSEPYNKFTGGRKPLHWAAANGHASVVKLLLERGADPGGRNATLRTPLQEAAMQKHYAVVKLLIDHKAPVNAQDDQGWAPLHEVAGGGGPGCYDVGLAKFLLDQGADVNLRTSSTDGGNNAQRFSRRTPLLLAIQFNRGGDMCKLLIEHKASVNARNNAGETALHLSAYYGWVGGITADLIDAGADMEATDPRSGETALFVATRQHAKEKILRTLLEKGANVRATNLLGQDALQIAQMLGKKEEARILNEYKEKSEIGA